MCTRLNSIDMDFFILILRFFCSHFPLSYLTIKETEDGCRVTIRRPLIMSNLNCFQYELSTIVLRMTKHMLCFYYLAVYLIS